jgi:hypothetical protein
VRDTLLGILCIVVLCGILVAGLWPFRSPKNGATWLKGRNGLLFSDYATVIGAGALTGRGLGDSTDCSIEIWIPAVANNQGGTILSFYTPKHPLEFSLHQSLTDLMLQSVSSNPSGRMRRERAYVSDVFSKGRPVFVTITAGAYRTSIYIDGNLIRSVQGFRITPLSGAGGLIVGDTPRQPNTWSGQVRGLAIYSTELSPSRVLRHYSTWTNTGLPDIIGQDRTAALYLFDERAGDRIHNHAGPGADLFIPGTYTVMDKVLLEPFWEEFTMSLSYWTNVLKNIVGFVPLGACFCAYFALVKRSGRASLAAVIVGFAVSLTIEVLQGYLPTRDSGTTDLITNTLGTWLGVLLYCAANARWNQLSWPFRTASVG